MISFCIPAHNEKQLLPATLAAINEAGRELSLDFEIVVADDASTDGTDDAAVAGDARVTRIDRRQISAARNAAARTSLGEVIFFIDADTRIHATAVSQALVLIQSGCVGGGALPTLDGRVPLWIAVMLCCMAVLYRLANVSSGAFMFCTREAFNQSGGFDETLFAGEEVHFAIALKRVGRFRLIQDRVLTSGRKVRAYSAREMLEATGRILGKKGRSSREGLDFWYGPRRPDPNDARTNSD